LGFLSLSDTSTCQYADGHMLLVGSIINGAQSNVVLVRFNQSGVDLEFGVKGWAVIDLPNSDSERALGCGE
jgi:hypothetical protein